MLSCSVETRLRVLSFAALFLLLSTCLSEVSVVGQTLRSQVTQIDSYTGLVRAYIKRHPKARRIFGDVAPYDEEKSNWREFKTKAEAEKHELYESAYVWNRAGKIVAANYTLSSPSGDWAHFINYYFRDDGSLAKIESRLNTFYGDVSVVRNQYFNDRGSLISSSRTVLDLKTQKPKKSREYMDQPVPVYRKVTELPFSNLL